MSARLGGTLAVSLLPGSTLAVRVGLFQAPRPQERPPSPRGEGRGDEVKIPPRGRSRALQTEVTQAPLEARPYPCSHALCFPQLGVTP